MGTKSSNPPRPLPRTPQPATRKRPLLVCASGLADPSKLCRIFCFLWLSNWRIWLHDLQEVYSPSETLDESRLVLHPAILPKVYYSFFCRQAEEGQDKNPAEASTLSAIAVESKKIKHNWATIFAAVNRQIGHAGESSKTLPQATTVQVQLLPMIETIDQRDALQPRIEVRLHLYCGIPLLGGDTEYTWSMQSKRASCVSLLPIAKFFIYISHHIFRMEHCS